VLCFVVFCCVSFCFVLCCVVFCFVLVIRITYNKRKSLCYTVYYSIVRLRTGSSKKAHATNCGDLIPKNTHDLTHPSSTIHTPTHNNSNNSAWSISGSNSTP
jgi:hypothetical protein